MSRIGTKRPASAYQVAVMLVAAALGFIGAPWWMVLIAAMLLFGGTLIDDAEAQARVVYASAAAAAGSAALALAALSLGYASICYIGGYALAALLN